MSSGQPILLVGDNPFHGISHLSQQSVKNRGMEVTRTKYASDLVKISIENGANGFMFSVSDTTLAILHMLPEKDLKERLNLYALVPYAYEYVRLATHSGGIPGLAKRFADQVLRSGNLKTAAIGLKGVLTSNPIDVMKAYLSYEIIRIKASAKNRGTLRSVLLHEVITDMAIALNLESLVKSYIKFMIDHGIEPGFETRNFSYFVNKFKKWSIDLNKIIVATPFNSIGFYMNPSKADCEKTLIENPPLNVIVMSILAAGYLTLPEAITYIKAQPGLNRIVVGVSKEQQARETFQFLSKYYANKESTY